MAIEREIKVRLTTNQQAKLAIRDGSLEQIIFQLRRGLEMAEFTFHPSVWLMRDEYFDIPDLLLYKGGYSLRKRAYGEEMEGTFKIPKTARAGVLERGEIEETLLADGGWPQEIVSALRAPPLKLELSNLSLQCVVESKRIKVLAARDPVVLELSIDEFVAKRWGLSSEPQFELEIEQKSAPVGFRLDEYKDRLGRYLGADLDSTPASKYQRAIHLWRLDRPRIFQIVARVARNPDVLLIVAIISVIVGFAAWVFPLTQ